MRPPTRPRAAPGGLLARAPADWVLRAPFAGSRELSVGGQRGLLLEDVPPANAVVLVQPAPFEDPALVDRCPRVEEHVVDIQLGPVLQELVVGGREEPGHAGVARLEPD